MKHLLFFFFFTPKLLACALCASYTPTAFISLDFQKDLKSINVTWDLSNEFTKILLHSYDSNYNDSLDEDELKAIQEAFYQYIIPREHLSEIIFYDNGKERKVNIHFSNDQFFLKQDTLSYSYTLSFDEILKKGDIFSLNIKDTEGYFSFKFHNLSNIALNDELYLQSNPNSELVFFEVVQGNIQNRALTNTLFDEIPSEFNWFEKLTNTLFDFLKQLVRDGYSFTNLFFVLGIAFLYGMFHASAPGHSKALTSSYFLTQKSSYRKIAIFCLKIGLVHILSAFIIVSIAVFTLNLLLSSFSSNTHYIITKLSSLMIIIIALYMLGKKILTKHQQSCDCNHCTTNKLSEWGIVNAAGIIPCPGMLLLFLFAYEFNFTLAVLSAFFVGLGMSFVLFVFALIANTFHKRVYNVKLRTSLEYFGITAMLIFGIFLFTSTRMGIF
ncbi:DUF1007 family protein [Campylobacter sp. MIT 21-1685]|uniref:nickel/cobalt transporter n=1 Tax=unclassified Campylobacter TaxID=2593542 RepID=UPI00224A9CAE|nr:MULTISPECIES: DUF1007 family protein [unclassified Campylobacter]MCX2683775.1 DUF1007 family protein [Campylobacter sp. MIT 21-1684]MCX2752050.1 DUF1007 family protein [Campylobacter sp. MIT 21-1682]MCX2808252.1 DUF1007 family protein [Campylobacter sp. MIT 21-1685]